MALQYDTSVQSAAFKSALADNPRLTATTQAAIDSILNLDNAPSVVVAGWNGVTETVTAPAGSTPDALVISFEGAAGTELNLPDAVTDTKVIIIDSDAGVNLTVGEEAASARLFAAAAVEDAARVVVGGNGNDVLTVNGSANVYLDGGDGNDTLTTGSGDDIIVAGKGTNTVNAGAGNDTIVTGAGIDTIDAGDGRDTIEVIAARDQFTTSVVGNSLVLTGTGASAGNSVSVSNAEFVTFADGKTLAIASTEAEGQALSLYQALLGRDVDSIGAEHFSNTVGEGASLNTIVDSFLRSEEHYDNLRGEWLKDVYSSLLGREVDSTGVATWQEKFDQGATRGDVIASIVGSDEGKAAITNDADFVSALYQAALGRDAEEAGLQSWVAQLESGVSRTQVADSIYSSAESNAHINADFIDSLFTNLGNDSAKDIAHLALDNGATQAEVVVALIGEIQDHATNVVVVPGAV